MLETLPKDVLFSVLLVCDCKTILSCRCTCQDLNTVITDSLVINCSNIDFTKKGTRPSSHLLKIEQNLMKKWYQDHTDQDNQLEITIPYLCFIQMLKYYPGDVLVPPEVVDEVWHKHILDTRGYAEFCGYFFGRFVHHDPGLPSDSILGVVQHETHQKFVDLFGSAFDDSIWKSDYSCYGVNFFCCFEGNALIMGVQGKKVFVKDVKIGDLVMGGDGKVHKVVKIEAKIGKLMKFMVKLGDFWITRGHPVLWNGEWFRPDELFPSQWMEVEGLYIFVLEEEHTVVVGGEKEFVCCTLGKDCGKRLKLLFPHQDQFYGNSYISKGY